MSITRSSKSTRRLVVALLASLVVLLMLYSQSNMLGGEENTERAHSLSPLTRKEASEEESGPLSQRMQQYILSQQQVLTREYSFKWNKTALQPRTARVSDLQKELAHMLGVRFDPDTSVTSMRLEFAFEKFAKTCGISIKGITMRVREYLLGDRAGYRTVDLKANSAPAEKEATPSTELEDWVRRIVDLPFDLAPSYKDRLVINKLEEDYHLCSIKFSREARTLIPLEEPLRSCGHVDRYFPRLGVKKHDKTLVTTYDALWWVYKVEGHAFFTPPGGGQAVEVKIESTFTLQYPKRPPALTADLYARMIFDPATGDMIVPSSKSEWSFRLFAPGEGHQPWRADLIRHFDDKFALLVDQFRLRELLISDPKEHCTPE